MRIGVTGGTGFIGRYVLRELLGGGHHVVAWYRNQESRSGIESHPQLTWIEGSLETPESVSPLIDGCDAVVHAALWRPGSTFRGGEGDIVRFAETNIVGSLRLIDAAVQAGVERFIYVSTCAVHEKILDDRPLDETHPLWPYSHYGAHKAAVEKFVHSYGLGQGYPISAIRPTGVYGLSHRPKTSKFYGLVRDVAKGKTVECQKGGKEVHAADVARAISCLLRAPAEAISGEAFNCYDRYVAEYDVAMLARELSGSNAEIIGNPKSPKNQIQTEKIRLLGMTFGGEELLRRTVGELLESVASVST